MNNCNCLYIYVYKANATFCRFLDITISNYVCAVMYLYVLNHFRIYKNEKTNFLKKVCHFRYNSPTYK